MELLNVSAREERHIFYSPTLNEIYQRQGKTIVNWFVSEKKRTTITRHVDSQNTTSSIPADAYSINFISNN